MTISNVLTFIGLIFTFFISLFTLVLTIKNRRNTIREHIFKEQFNLFVQLGENISLQLDLINEVLRTNNYNDEHDKLFDEYLDKFYFLTDKYDLIVPNDLFPLINLIYKEGCDLSLSFIKADIDETKVKVYQNNCFDFQDCMREILGIEKLSYENRKLVGNERIRITGNKNR